MTLPDMTDPSRPKKRSHMRPARSTNDQQPVPRNTDEDVKPTDRPLHYTVPDKKLQRRALAWVVVAFVASLASTCIVAIAVDSTPAALVTADLILAAAIFAIVRYVYPGPGRS